jgi:hypothetical protein
MVREHVDEALAPVQPGVQPQVVEAFGAFGVGGRAREDAFERDGDEGRRVRTEPGGEIEDPSFSTAFNGSPRVRHSS